ncbi:MAG: DUF6512 family protein [Bacillota bacterium]|nr:DUF6512 family protein [Bacillota bacterium]
MKQQCKYGTLFVIINTVILGIFASLSHFAYDLSGNSVIVGIFNPINESVWEHLKFMFFPNLLWWIIIYFIQKKSCDIDIQKWIISTAVSVVTAPLMVIFLFYSYTEAFGVESVIIDILLVFVCYFIALKLAFHIYQYVKPSNLKVIISILIISIIFVAFIVFTFNPPHLPIFFDKTTGTYGI